MGIKDRYLEFENAKAQQAAIKYIEWVMKEENTDFRTAQMMCETVPEYSLGLKLSVPSVQQMLNKGSAARRAANKKKFLDQLPENEKIIFLQIGDTKQEFKDEMKKQKREAKKKKVVQ